MSVHFSHELDELKKKLVTMAGHAESAVTRAMKAALERDDDLARAVKEDDSILDDYEKEIDEVAINLLAKAPLASELRLITVAMKISHDLERVGDEATTIARRAIELNKEPALSTEVDLHGMAGLGLQMLKESIDAFVRGDSSRARALIPRDKTIDSLNKQLQRELASYMVERPSTISRCLHLMTISKSLERIGDHATNIAEEAVYLLEGEDIRHNPQVRQPPGEPQRTPV
jgi:phosphate transport system protein